MVEIGGKQFLLGGGRGLSGDFVLNGMQVLGADRFAEFAEDRQRIPEIIPVEGLRSPEPKKIDGQQNKQKQRDEAINLLGG